MKHREFQQLFAKSATYDENLAFLRNMLQALHRWEWRCRGWLYME